MENEAFEMQGEKIPELARKKEEYQKIPEKSLLRFFLLCLLASALSTALGVLVLALVVKNPPEIPKNPPEILNKNPPEIPKNPPEIPKNPPEIPKNPPEILNKNPPEIPKNPPEIPKNLPEIPKNPPEIPKNPPEILNKNPPEIPKNPPEILNKNPPEIPKNPPKGEGKFRFYRRLGEAKVYKYPGGEMQWARYRRDPQEYETPQAQEFGESLNFHQSQITVGSLRIQSQGLRAPHWHLNANEHGYLVKGEAWIGIVGADGSPTVTYNVTAGQVVFFPRNTLHWVKNVGPSPLLFLLFFSTHRELLTLDLDDAFFGTPEDVAARALKPIGGVNFIRTFQKPQEDQAINLPPNLPELIHNSSYPQSPSSQVWKFFFDLPASKEFPFPGGIFQWARFRKNGTGLNENEKIFSESLHEHENSLTLATLRIFSNNLGVPHFHFNAHEVGVVLQGCGQVGLILPEGNLEFSVSIGDVVFFPLGSQHFVLSHCQEDLLMLLAYSTNNQLETLRMNQYFHGTADHILAQLFRKDQLEFQKIPKKF